ncbi:hypothetical protein M758_5G023400 [Ceratodon purpureus]|nr:hypothetical protein M758_5G023400 [Ceratodon purpureus]
MMQLQVWSTTIGILFLTSVAASQTCGPTALNCSDPTPCCSNSNSCGNTTVHCGIGCLSQYSAPEACIFSKENSSWPATTIAATTEPRCGIDPNTNHTYDVCEVKDYCCSPYGYCGVGDTHCVGCQKGYGRCPTLCDPSRLCGGIGIASFTISVFSLFFALVGLIIQYISRPRDRSLWNRIFG